jgi:hypothetical protein
MLDKDIKVLQFFFLDFFYLIEAILDHAAWNFYNFLTKAQTPT